MIYKHPLFWKEWKTVKWWSGLISAMFLVMFLSMSHSLSQTQARLLTGDQFLGEYGTGLGGGGRVLEPIFVWNFTRTFGTLVLLLVPIIVMISVMLFQSDRKESVGKFVSSLPFTKKEQFKYKWIVGILAFTIPFVLGALLLIAMRQVNMSWISKWYADIGFEGLVAYDRAGIVLGVLAQSYLAMVALFSVLMLTQSLIANHIGAGVIGAIIAAVPWFILELGGSTLSHIFKKNWRIYHAHWASLYYYMRTDSGASSRMLEPGPIELYIDPIVSKEDYIIKIVILIVISLVASYGGLRLYEKNDLGRNGYLVMFPAINNLLILGVGLCTGLLGNNLMRQLVKIPSAPYEVLTFTISALVGCTLMNKIIHVSEK